MIEEGLPSDIGSYTGSYSSIDTASSSAAKDYVVQSQFSI
jgi:hypothetical protein